MKSPNPNKMLSPSPNKTFIHREILQDNFTRLPNSIFEDPNLSWEAKGLLGYLLSRKETWEVHLNHLATIYKGSKKGNRISAIRTIIKELKNQGYMSLDVTKDADGHFEFHYYVYMSPREIIPKMFPVVDCQLVGDQLVGDRMLTRTELRVTTEREQQQVENPEPYEEKATYQVVVVPSSEEKVTHSEPNEFAQKVKELEPYPFKTKDLKELYEFPLRRIQLGITAYESYKTTHFVKSPLACLKRAITENWMPPVKKEEIEEKKEIEMNSKSELGRNISKLLLEKYEPLFTPETYFTISEECVYLRTRQGTEPVALTDHNLKKRIQLFARLHLLTVEDHLKPIGV